MIVIDRLQRGDFPRMVAITAEQGDKNRLVFADHAGADAFIDAYRRADNAASLEKREIDDMSLSAFWEACRDHDWQYANSDDHSAWQSGGTSASRLLIHKMQSDQHSRIYMAWKRHHHRPEQFPEPSWADFADAALSPKAVAPATDRNEVEELGPLWRRVQAVHSDMMRLGASAATYRRRMLDVLGVVAPATDAAHDLVRSPDDAWMIEMANQEYGHHVGAGGPYILQPTTDASTQPVKPAGDYQELLGEKLFNLSGMLKASGFLDDAAHHDAYEAVVAAFNAPALAPATDTSTQPVKPQGEDARTDFRMNLARALFEASYGMKLCMWSDETRDHWLARADVALTTVPSDLVAMREAPKLPRLTYAMIEAACAGHYGKKATDQLGIGGIDLTAAGVNHTFEQGFRRMWRGIAKHLSTNPRSPDHEG